MIRRLSQFLFIIAVAGASANPLSYFGQALTGPFEKVARHYTKARSQRNLLEMLHATAWLSRHHDRNPARELVAILVKEKQLGLAYLIAEFNKIPINLSDHLESDTATHRQWFLEWYQFVSNADITRSNPLINPDNPHILIEILLANNLLPSATDIIGRLQSDPFDLKNWHLYRINSGNSEPPPSILFQTQIKVDFPKHWLLAPLPLHPLTFADGMLQINMMDHASHLLIDNLQSKIEKIWIATTDLDVRLKPLTITSITDTNMWSLNYDADLGQLFIPWDFWLQGANKVLLDLKWIFARHQLRSNFNEQEPYILDAASQYYAKLKPGYFGSDRNHTLWPLSKYAMQTLGFPYPNQLIQRIHQDQLTELGTFLFDRLPNESVLHRIFTLAKENRLSQELQLFYERLASKQPKPR